MCLLSRALQARRNPLSPFGVGSGRFFFLTDRAQFGLGPEHVSKAERCHAQLNIPLCGHALRSVAHGQSKHSANVPLTVTGKPNPAQIRL